MTHGPYGKFNFAFYRIGHPPFGMSVRRRLLEQLHVDLAIDCGANVGQYALGLRNAGYGGAILSIEPGREPYEALVRLARYDPLWRCIRAATYDTNTRISLNISAASPCNSILEPLEAAQETVAGLAKTATEEVDARTLDSIVTEYAPDASRIWLKLDVEGAELKTLAGAEGLLDRVVALEVELGLVPIYRGEPMFFDVARFLYEKGFFMANAAGAYQDSAGTWIKIDATFLRDDLRGKVRL